MICRTADGQSECVDIFKQMVDSIGNMCGMLDICWRVGKALAHFSSS